VTQASVNASIEAFGRTLALELAPQRVNVVSPGFIDTEKLLSHLPPTDRAYQLLESKGANFPTRRVGQPEDAAATYLFRGYHAKIDIFREECLFQGGTR
jgi:NAD(P)-dependent dehydrogenase (short-subunit alcohol dehydrogenase family)